MITIRPCTVADIFSSDLLESYSDESAIEGMPRPCPDLPLYTLLEGAGALYCIGAFVEQDMVGFITVISQVLPHYGKMVSSPESFYVSLPYRKTGAGTKLLKAAEQRARDTNSVGLLVSAPYCGKLEKVMDKMPGYRRSNSVFFRGM